MSRAASRRQGSPHGFDVRPILDGLSLSAHLDEPGENSRVHNIYNLAFPKLSASAGQKASRQKTTERLSISLYGILDELLLVFTGDATDIVVTRDSLLAGR